MESLLEKIHSLEEEAQQLIENAETKRETALQQLRADEKKALSRAREQADSKARAIIEETVQKAKSDAHHLFQQEQAAVKDIQKNVGKNRPAAVQALLDLFVEKYQ